MGAIILADPALRRVRDHHGATPLFVTFAHNRNSLRLIATVDETDVFCLRASGPGVLLVDLVRFRRWTRRQGVDAVVDLELFTRFSAILALLAGARLRVGLHCFDGEGLWRGNLFTRRVRYDPGLPMARSFLALAESAFVPPSMSGEVPMPCETPVSLPARRIPAAESRVAEQRITKHFPPLIAGGIVWSPAARSPE